LLTEEEKIKFIYLINVYIPDDLDIFWINNNENPFFILFEDMSDESRIKLHVEFEKSKESAVKVEEELVSIPEYGIPSLKKLTLIKRPEENMSCNESRDLFIIGSHYSTVPIFEDPKFLKCSDRTSKFKNIDFLNVKENVKCVNLMINDINVRILGIEDLLRNYNKHRREKDTIKIEILNLIITKLDGDNKYIGNYVYI
jgi:hypothetical protein